ncbi:hypothetical protein D6C99_05755 [Aureobasidium pullulans]|uniref:Uncharacterized protein n=1 Tax=Aureobasidium pullulans TaxID=5580 RepID=A0A4S9ATS7_AURPU|nr:hypothetical protein D6D15_09641 [Aureobasidium pullulans]THY47486.1 hypothetical protein D6C99_05755 [Aureobasidium pullulans]
MRENQMTHPSLGSKILVDKVRFVDFTSHFEDGLGVLGRLPREIREMVYGFLGSSLHCHNLDGRCEKQTYYALRMLQDFAIMKTSKQICVEFLEAFVRQKVFVTYLEMRNCSDSHFETFLRYLNRRIRISPNIRQIGFRIDTMEHEKFFKSVARYSKRLWHSREDHKIPANRLFIATQHKSLAELIDDTGTYLPGYFEDPENQLRKAIAGPQQRHEASMKRHDALIHQTADLWTAMEQQYSVYHLFDLAESWLITG